MSSDLVADWFGRDFGQLHPLLQRLHRDGGRLGGQVTVDLPTGLRGFIGRRLASRLGVPTQRGSHALEVTISHRDGVLHWDRCFDAKTFVVSRFTPVGRRCKGCWIEETGPLRMALTVDIVDGGWHWRVLSLRFMNMPLPLALFPHARACKTIVGDRYRFFVGFALPMLGTVLSYGGDLSLAPSPWAFAPGLLKSLCTRASAPYKQQDRQDESGPSTCNKKRLDVIATNDASSERMTTKPVCVLPNEHFHANSRLHVPSDAQRACAALRNRDAQMNTRRSDPRDIVDDSIWFSTSSARRGKHTADAGRAAATVRVMIVAALVSAVSLVIWWS